MKTRAIAAAVLLVTACGAPGAEASREDSTPDTSRAIAQGPDPAHVLFGCLVGDSAVYSDVGADSVAGGASGITINFWQAGDGIDGSSAAGGVPERSVPLASVQLTGPDSVVLNIPREASSPDTSVFVGRVACDSLWGHQQTSRTSPPRNASYRRVH